MWRPRLPLPPLADQRKPRERNSSPPFQPSIVEREKYASRIQDRERKETESGSGIWLGVFQAEGGSWEKGEIVELLVVIVCGFCE